MYVFQVHPACEDSGVTVVDDLWRLPTTGAGTHCDEDLIGWHRFRVNGQDTTIATSYIEVSNKCD